MFPVTQSEGFGEGGGGGEEQQRQPPQAGEGHEEQQQYYWPEQDNHKMFPKKNWQKCQGIEDGKAREGECRKPVQGT